MNLSSLFKQNNLNFITPDYFLLNTFCRNDLIYTKRSIAYTVLTSNIYLYDVDYNIIQDKSFVQFYSFYHNRLKKPSLKNLVGKIIDGKVLENYLFFVCSFLLFHDFELKISILKIRYSNKILIDRLGLHK